jgi:hypothetical protein
MHFSLNNARLVPTVQAKPAKGIPRFLKQARCPEVTVFEELFT